MAKKKPINNIRFLRLYFGMPQWELAERVGIAQNHVSKLELGKLVPTSKTLKKFSTYFSRRLRIKVNPDILMDATVHDRVVATLTSNRIGARNTTAKRKRAAKKK